MALPPQVGQLQAVQHSNDPVTIIDYPQYVSVMEWSGAQSSASGVSPITTYLPLGTGVNDDAAAINAAFVALAGSGISLFFPAGIYLVTAAAIVTKSVPVIIAAGATFTGTYAATIPNAAIPAAYKARAVMTTTAVASYTGTGTNVLTAGSNAALVAQDGVTMAVGDIILLQGGTLGSLAITAADIGPWVITSLGASGAKFVFTRPSWWATGNVIPTAVRIDVGPEGTLFPDTTWTTWAAPAKVIGTDDPVLYPDRVMSQVTVTNGVIALSAGTCPPLRSATKSVVVPTIVNGQVTGTSTGVVGLAPLVITPGYTGTAAVTITAMGTNGAAVTPTSTILSNVLFTNR